MNVMNEIRKDFTFLNEYGYCLTEREQQLSVCYEGRTNKVLIYYSNYTYEISCQFLDCHTKHSFSLQDALDCNYQDFEGVKGVYQFSNCNDAIKGVVYIADIVNKLYKIIDISEADNFEKIYQLTKKNREKSLSEYYLKQEMKHADCYYEKNMHAEALNLYKKHYADLTKVQKKKMEILSRKIK